MSNSEREFEVVIWGATGFTGRLTAEHLARTVGDDRSLRWAIGGRDRQKLDHVAEELGSSSQPLPQLIGDSRDRAALDEMVRRTSVICSTVGPYAKYGSELVAACAEHGTHYCDLSGEVHWMREMIDRHQGQARQSGARIVHCCGFDSIPSDLGCYFLQQRVQADAGTVCQQVKLRVQKMRGSFSGGTYASLLNVLEAGQRDRRVQAIIDDPYALNPIGERGGPDGPDLSSVRWDADLRTWTGPFVMAPINTRVVRRSNALLNYQYGRDFRYEEAIALGRGPVGWTMAQGLSHGLAWFMAAAAARPTRRVLDQWVLPRPGQGPSRRQREQGYFEIQLVGKAHVTATDFWSARVTGDQDPGYGTTSKMLAESAVSLAQDADQLAVGGGFWTPASCFGRTLVQRLEERAGMRFVMSTRPQ